MFETHRMADPCKQTTLLLLVLSVLLSTFLVQADQVHSPKIIGGSDVDISDFPWQVSLQIDGRHHCGGSIISELWVLSAAHCTDDDYEIQDLDVWVGSSSFDDQGKLYRVADVVNHAEWNDSTIINDICALLLSEPLAFGRTVSPVRLPAMGDKQPEVDTKLLVSGWGVTEDGTKSKTLKAIQVVLADFSNCKNMHDGADEATQVCAGVPGKNVCSSDSGGPLVSGDLLVGIVSYGNRNCDTEKYFYSAYTDVTAYREWIRVNTDV